MKAHDALILINENTLQFSSIKRLLRLVSDDDVTIAFTDGSKLIFKRTKSWRTDKFEIKNG